MAKKRQRGKLGGILKTEEDKSPTTDDLKKMLEETEGIPSTQEIKKKVKMKVKIGTQVDSDLYDTFKTKVKNKGMKLGFVIEKLMKQFLEENS